MRPRLILFLGVQLSGKTVLSKKISKITGIPHVSTDEIRQKLFGPNLLGPRDWANPEAKVANDTGVKIAHDCLFIIIEKVLKSGGSLVAETTKLKGRDKNLRQIAKSTGADIKIICCQISNDRDNNGKEIKRRVQKRLANKNLAPIREEDYWMFKKNIQKPKLRHLAVDTSQPQEVCLAQIRKYIET